MHSRKQLEFSDFVNRKFSIKSEFVKSKIFEWMNASQRNLFVFIAKNDNKKM